MNNSLRNDTFYQRFGENDIFSKDTIHPGLGKSLRVHAGFSDSEILEFQSYLEIKSLKRKDHLLRPGEISCVTSYVSKGCLRRYTIDEHAKEVILNFAVEDWWIGDLESFIAQKPTVYYVQALEESELLTLSHQNFIRLCHDIPKYQKFHDEKVQRNHYATLKRLAAATSATPEEKYLQLEKEMPQLFLRIPLHYIASYLGIEPESLSRLRKRLMGKPVK